jgi:Delta7-sterol 5-desaturase
MHVHAVTATNLLRLLQSFVTVYAVLLGCYLATGVAITRLNRQRAELKIQKNRAPSPAQVARDMRQSIVSLAVIALLFALGNWFYSRFGWGFHPKRMTVPGALLSFAASMVLYDTWFYWLHRLIHHKRLYRHVHRWHHMTTAPVVWSNNSDTLLDNCFLQSYWLIAHFILPISPIVLLAHKIYDQITGAIGHSGHEYGGRFFTPPSPLASVTHHDRHHQHFRCNYATHFTLWDWLMGTLDDRPVSRAATMRER